jgi:hypothetical protein
MFSLKKLPETRFGNNFDYLKHINDLSCLSISPDEKNAAQGRTEEGY